MRNLLLVIILFTSFKLEAKQFHQYSGPKQRWWHTQGYPSHYYPYGALLDRSYDKYVLHEDNRFLLIEDASVVKVSREPFSTSVHLSNGMTFQVEDKHLVIKSNLGATVLARYYHRRHTEHLLLIGDNEFLAYRLS